MKDQQLTHKKENLPLKGTQKWAQAFIQGYIQKKYLLKKAEVEGSLSLWKVSLDDVPIQGDSP